MTVEAVTWSLDVLTVLLFAQITVIVICLSGVAGKIAARPVDLDFQRDGGMSHDV